MEKEKHKNSCDDLEDFTKRSSSSIFSSLRAKKEKKTKKRFSASKSIFSTLLLANYEEHFYLTTGGIDAESLSRESNQVKLREKVNQKIMKEKALKELEANNFIDNESHKSESSSDDEEFYIDTCANQTTLISVESCSQTIYEDVLFNILHRLNKARDEGEEEDQIEIDKESALQYVRDALGVDKAKHDELLKKVEDLKDDANNFTVISNSTPFKDHCNLLKNLLKLELESSQIPQYFWSGKFSFLASTIISPHADYLSINDLVPFARWSAFIEIHRHYPLNLKTFHDLLDEIIEEYKDEVQIPTFIPFKPSRLSCLGLGNLSVKRKVLESSTNRCGDEIKVKDEKIVKSFWNSSQKLTESFTNFIRQIHFKLDDDKSEILEEIFKIEKRIEKIMQLDNFEDPRFIELLKKALTEGTAEHLTINVRRKTLKNNNNFKRLKELIRIMNFAERHLNEITKKYSKLFESHFNFSFSEHLFKVYDTELTHLIKPIVIEICETKEGNIDNFDKIKDEVATKLFELYLNLKAFTDNGSETYGNLDLRMARYYEWFTANVDKWNMVSVFNAITRYDERIERAVEKDTLKPEIKSHLFSSSAIDVMQILYSVKKFWEDLKWANANREFEVKKHVAHDITRFTMNYFDQMSEKVKNLDSMRSSPTAIFKFPIETFVVIANFNKVSRESEACINELMKGVKNFERVSENSQKYAENAINQILEFTFKKMSVTMRKLMLEGAERNAQQKEDVADRLMVYIEDTLASIQDDISSNYVENAKQIFWTQILTVLEEVIQVSIQRQMTPQFFSNLKQILTIFKEIFQISENDEDEKLKKIELILDCYGLNTSRLIHQYYKDRYNMQLQIHKTPFNPYGMITVICYFVKNTLKLEVLNARNLIPIGPNKKCDSYVQITIAPQIHFQNFKSFKTKVQQNTHFPLYDESFELEISEEQKNIKDAVICFNIKDKYIIGSDECIAEAFLSFRDVPEYTPENKIQQIHLTLTRLQSDEIESLKALKHRADASDKDAKEFLSKLKSRTLISPKKLKIPVTQL